MNEEKKQPFPRQTKHGGIVSCDFFDDCAVKIDGAGCKNCRRNLYSEFKSSDNFQPLFSEGAIEVDNLVGVCEFGDIRIAVGPNWKDCKVFLNGKLCSDVVGIQVVMANGILTQCHLAVLKPKSTGAG